MQRAHRVLLLTALLAVATATCGADADTPNAAPALDARRLIAEQGDAQAQSALGTAYLNGEGVERDYVQAMKWYRLAADQGDPGAEYMVGHLYRWVVADDPGTFGLDASVDTYAEALAWYEKSALHGGAMAQIALGDWYLGPESVKWYRMAADQESLRAMRSLALLYAEGRRMPRDLAESLAWYRKAAAAGDGAAKFQIGYIHEHGRGVARDADAAAKWYRDAADHGDRSARAALRAIAEPPLAACKRPAVAPTDWLTHGSPVLVLQLPPGAKQSASIENEGEHIEYTGDGFDVRITSKAYAPLESTPAELVAHGGGNARIELRPATDGSGTLSIAWFEVGLTNTRVDLAIEYANRRALGAACEIARRAHLHDHAADVTVTRVDLDAKPPYAMIRSIQGHERKASVDDIITREYGRVAAIAAGEVEVVELHPNGAGGWREVPLLLAPGAATK